MTRPLSPDLAARLRSARAVERAALAGARRAEADPGTPDAELDRLIAAAMAAYDDLEDALIAVLTHTPTKDLAP